MGPEVAAILAALIGFLSGMVATHYQHQQRSDDLFFKALEFLDGGTQKRNLGIAAIELYWKNKRHRSLCVSLLAGTAIYLLVESGQRDKAHELNNLRRVMDLLLRDDVLNSNQDKYSSLKEAIVEVKEERNDAGVIVPPEELEAWRVKMGA